MFEAKISIPDCSSAAITPPFIAELFENKEARTCIVDYFILKTPP